jgi:hypothetical protein
LFACATFHPVIPTCRDYTFAQQRSAIRILPADTASFNAHTQSTGRGLVQSIFSPPPRRSGFVLAPKFSAPRRWAKNALQYVAPKIMWRPANNSVGMNGPIARDAT